MAEPTNPKPTSPFLTDQMALERSEIDEYSAGLNRWAASRAQQLEPAEPAEPVDLPESIGAKVSPSVDTPEPMPADDSVFVSQKDSDELEAKQRHLIEGLTKAGWKDLSLDTLRSRISAGIAEQYPKTASAPKRKGFSTTSLEQSSYGPKAWVRDAQNYIDPENNYPATELPYYGQSRGFNRPIGWLFGREGFTGVQEGEEPAPKLENLQAPTARELIGQAQASIREEEDGLSFENFEPLMITPGALKVLRLDLRRMGIPEQQAEAIPLEYVAPLWDRVRKQNRQISKQLKEADKISDINLVGSARVLGQKETKEVQAKLSSDPDVQAFQKAVLASKPTKGAKDALLNAGFTDRDQDLLDAYEAFEIQNIDSYQDYARKVESKPKVVGENRVKYGSVSPIEGKVPLVYIKDKGWNIDANKIHQALSFRRHQELWADELERLEGEGLTTETAMQQIRKDEPFLLDIKKKAEDYAYKRILTFLGQRSGSVTPVFYQQEGGSNYTSEYYDPYDVPSPPPGAPMTPAQALKFVGPFVVGYKAPWVSTSSTPISPGNIYEGRNIQNISKGQLSEFLRSASSTIIGSHLLSWSPPDSSDPQVVWESLWEHWGSPEHYEELTTGQFDLTERFYDVGDRTTQLLQATPGVGNYVPDFEYLGKKRLGLALGLPILLTDFDYLALTSFGLGRVLKPVARGIRMVQNSNTIEALESIAKTMADTPVLARKELQTKVAKSKKGTVSPLLKLIDASVGSKLQRNDVNSVFALSDEIKRTQDAVVSAEKKLDEAKAELNQANIAAAQREVNLAKKEAFDAQVDASANIQALAEQELKVAQRVEKDAFVGLPKVKLTDAADIDKVHEAAKLNFSSLLEEPLPGGSLKSEVWKVESEYQVKRRQLISDIADTLSAQEKKAGRVLRRTAAEVRAEANLTDLSRKIAQTEKLIESLSAAAKPSEAMVETRKLLEQKEKDLAKALEPDLKIINKLGYSKRLPVQERWERYLADYPKNTRPKRIAALRSEIQSLNDVLSTEAQRLAKADNKADLGIAQNTLERLRLEQRKALYTLRDRQQTRFKRQPVFGEELLEPEQVPFKETLENLNKDEKSAFIKKIQRAYADESGIWRGQITRRTQGKTYYSKPVQVQIEGGQILIGRGSAMDAAPEFRPVSRAELQQKGIEVPTIDPKRFEGKAAEIPEMVTARAEFREALAEVEATRLKELKALGLTPEDPVLRELTNAAKALDRATAQRYALQRSVARLIAEEKLKEAKAAFKALVNKKVSPIDGQLLRANAQESLINAQKLLQAKKLAAERTQNILRETLTEIADSLRAENRLLRTGGKRYSNFFEDMVQRLPVGSVAFAQAALGKQANRSLLDVYSDAALSIPDYVKYRINGLGGINIERVTPDPIITSLLKTDEGVGLVDEGAEAVISAKELRSGLEDRYGKRVVKDFIAASEKGEQRVPDWYTGRSYKELLDSTETKFKIEPQEIALLQLVEDKLAVNANAFWRQSQNLDLAYQLKIMESSFARSGVFGFIRNVFRSGALAERDMSDELRLVMQEVENLSSRGREELESLIRSSIDEGLDTSETVRVLKNYMDGTAIRIGSERNKMGETYINQGVNLWQSVRTNLLNDAVWTGEKAGKKFLVGRRGAEAKAEALARLEKRGITEEDVIAKYIEGKEVDGVLPDSVQAEAQAEWTKTLAKEFEKVLGIDSIPWAKGATDAPKSLLALSKVWYPRGVTAPIPADKMLRHAYTALHAAPDFPSFMTYMKKKMYAPTTSGGIGAGDQEDLLRAYHGAVLASIHAKVYTEGILRVAEIAGPRLNEQQGEAVKALISGNWSKATGGKEAFVSALTQLNQLGIPINTQMVGEQVDKATRLSRQLTKVSNNPNGMDAYAPTDIISSLNEALGAIEKEIELNISYTKTEKFINAVGEVNVIGPVAAWALTRLHNIFGTWRRGLVTGLLLPNPRHWTNTSTGNFFQDWQEQGLAAAMRYGFQSLPTNVPFIGRAMQDATSRAFAEGRLGTRIGSLYNTRLHDFWSMPTSEARKTFIRDRKGRLHNILDLRIRAARDGILSTFEAERGLLSTATLRAVRGEESFAGKLTRRTDDWNNSIAQMMVYAEQRNRTAFWLDRIIREGDSYADARIATLNARYDWKHGISRFERAKLVHLAAFWRWFSLAVRRHLSAISDSFTGKPGLLRTLTGTDKLGRIRRQLNVAKAIKNYSREDSPEQYDSPEAQWDDLMLHIDQWWADSHVTGGQTTAPLDSTVYWKDLTGKTYTHTVIAGPAIPAAEMTNYFLSTASGLSGLGALLTNSTASALGQEPPFLLTGGDSKYGKPGFVASAASVLDPVIDQFLPPLQTIFQQELGGYRTSYRSRPINIGEAAALETFGGKDLFNLFGMDVHIGDDNRWRANAQALALARQLPYWTQYTAYLSNYYTAKQDLQRNYYLGAATVLGNFLGIRKVPFSPEEQLKWDMRKIQNELKEEVEAARLPMERIKVSSDLGFD